ncbi:MAG TPA: hypothetical protein VML19_19740 [Verrucomicrobiae bacterium]|nr:hypothetical protein [Verrucomicrobiae bacterium]
MSGRMLVNMRLGWMELGWALLLPAQEPAKPASDVLSVKHDTQPSGWSAAPSCTTSSRQ